MINKLLILALLITLCMLSIPKTAHALTNPLESSNNIHGIHIIDENDLDEAAKLVNSSGGEWGYVTMVIQETDRDIDKWQRIFDRMRRLKLIPIIRIATYPKGPAWAQPNQSEAIVWRDFFEELNWVVENRYVILYNEPNHAAEWGGEIDPEGYADITKIFTQTLKQSNEDYFVLPAGMDLAAGDTNNTLSAIAYYERIAEHDPEYFTRFDGWTSHSYPNPNFSGSAFDTGRTSIRGYDWERTHLAQYGLSQTIPIFITETGWAHREGKNENTSFYSAEQVALLYEVAFESAWNDPYIVMVSPFLLNYQDSPFDHFSWKKLNSDEYYPQHQSVVSIVKNPGEPVQRDGAELNKEKTPLELTTNAMVFIPVTVKNIGQRIWERDNVRVQISVNNEPVASVQLDELEPNQTSTIKIPILTKDHQNQVTITSEVVVDDNTVGISDTRQIAILESTDSLSTIMPIVRSLAEHIVFSEYSKGISWFSLL